MVSFDGEVVSKVNRDNSGPGIVGDYGPIVSQHGILVVGIGKGDLGQENGVIDTSASKIFLKGGYLLFGTRSSIEAAACRRLGRGFFLFRRGLSRAAEVCAGRQRSVSGPKDSSKGCAGWQRTAPGSSKEGSFLLLGFPGLFPDFPELGWLLRGVVAMRIRFQGLRIVSSGVKGKTWAPRAGRQSLLSGGRLSSRAAERSLVESFCWISRLMLFLKLYLAVGLRTSPYLHYNLILGLGSLSN
ncbi:hypothetical protein Tco_0722081 [Tanacetum coccineum]